METTNIVTTGFHQRPLWPHYVPRVLEALLPLCKYLSSLLVSSNTSTRFHKDHYTCLETNTESEGQNPFATQLWAWRAHWDSYHCLAPWNKQTWRCMMAIVDPRRRHELGSPLHILTIHYHRPGTHSHGNTAVWWKGAENRQRSDAARVLPDSTLQGTVLICPPLWASFIYKPH